MSSVVFVISEHVHTTLSPVTSTIHKIIEYLTWVDNSRMDLVEAGWGDVDWIVWLRIGTGGKLL
jgi:hypothetical protein